MSKDNYLELIKTADVYSVAKVSPLEHVELISKQLENKIFLKREDLQKTFSFKIRGAVNKLKHLQEELASNGVVCSSAGNHAQGVALAAKLAKKRAVIVMPQTTPSIKIATNTNMYNKLEEDMDINAGTIMDNEKAGKWEQTPFTYYVQIKESSSNSDIPPTIEYIGKYDGKFLGNGVKLQSVNWIPEREGLFFIETFVWDENNVPLAEQGPFVLILVK